jgi:hypothetical protein
MQNTEAHRLFEENSFAENQAGISLDGSKDKKDNRLSFNIGAFNDGLRSSFCKLNSVT